MGSDKPLGLNHRLEPPECRTTHPSFDNDAALYQKIFDIAMAQVESIVEPNSITDDIWRESTPFVGIHLPVPSIWDRQVGSNGFLITGRDQSTSVRRGPLHSKHS